MATDFSFGSCVNGKAPSPMTEAIAALRAEVTEDILRKKRDWFRENGDAEGKVVCAISGARISIEEAHADHAPPRPFGTLSVAFLRARGIEPSPTSSRRPPTTSISHSYEIVSSLTRGGNIIMSLP